MVEGNLDPYYFLTKLDGGNWNYLRGRGGGTLERGLAFSSGISSLPDDRRVGLMPEDRCSRVESPLSAESDCLELELLP